MQCSFLFFFFSHMDVMCHFLGRSSRPASLDIFESCATSVAGRRYQKGHCVSVSLCVLWMMLGHYKNGKEKNKRIR